MSVTTTARASARQHLLNQHEFKKLFDDYFEGICNYLYSHTKDWDVSEEIAQKTFVKLWEKRVQITINTSLKSYLYQSAKNTMIDEFRKNRYRSQFASRYEEITEKVAHMDIDDSDEKALQSKLLKWAITQLKPKTRNIFLLNKQDGLTYEEISTYLNIPKRTVEYNMKVALIKIKEMMESRTQSKAS